MEMASKLQDGGELGSWVYLTVATVVIVVIVVIVVSVC
jgi:hypothetical protein